MTAGIIHHLIGVDAMVGGISVGGVGTTACLGAVRIYAKTMVKGNNSYTTAPPAKSQFFDVRNILISKKTLR